eukprot:1555219-Prymnesium_polylepis.1
MRYSIESVINPIHNAMLIGQCPTMPDSLAGCSAFAARRPAPRLRGTALDSISAPWRRTLAMLIPGIDTGTHKTRRFYEIHAENTHRARETSHKRRGKRDREGDTVRPRREELVQLPRRNRTRAKAAITVAMPKDGGEAGDGEERVVGCSVSGLSCRSGDKRSAESAATVKLKEEELAPGSVEGVDGDGGDGR